jgi:hypothetical protein
VPPESGASGAEYLADRFSQGNRHPGTDGILRLPGRELIRAGHDYRELKTGLGLDHFEGRSFTGWHRHVTLAALAQAFCTLLRTSPKAPVPG